MTARSGDALSHVYFRAQQSVVLQEISASEFCETWLPPAPRDLWVLAPDKSFPSYLHGGHETALRNETDNDLHLPITCLNLSASSDDCIYK